MLKSPASLLSARAAGTCLAGLFVVSSARVGCCAPSPGQSPAPGFQVVQHPATTVVGIELPEGERNSSLIAYAWIALCPRLSQVKNQVDPQRLYGVWYRTAPGNAPLSYLVGVQVSAVEDLPEGLTSCEIPPASYLTLTHRGSPSRLGQAYAQIHQWLTKNRAQAQPVDAPTFELYDTRQPLNANYSILIHEPVGPRRDPDDARADP